MGNSQVSTTDKTSASNKASSATMPNSQVSTTICGQQNLLCYHAKQKVVVMPEKESELYLQDGLYASANVKKLTNQQEDAKKKTQQRKKMQRQAHPMNTAADQLDLLSKTRDKKTDCQSKMSVEIFTKRARDEMCEVELWWNHNHSVNSFHLQSFCPILPSTKLHLKTILRWACLPPKHSTTTKLNLCRILLP